METEEIYKCGCVRVVCMNEDYYYFELDPIALYCAIKCVFFFFHFILYIIWSFCIAFEFFDVCLFQTGNNTTLSTISFVIHKNCIFFYLLFTTISTKKGIFSSSNTNSTSCWFIPWISVLSMVDFWMNLWNRILAF